MPAGIDDPSQAPQATTDLVLSVWEALSSERSVLRVLEAAADALATVVPFDGVGLFSLTDETDSLAYVVGHRYRDGETTAQYLQRPEFAERVPVPDKPAISYERLIVDQVRVCNDLLACDAWFPHEREFAQSGIYGYVWAPLFAGGVQVGAALYMRSAPLPFLPAQVAVLTAASRAFAVAVANARANDEIARLRRELEAENLELKAQLGQAPWFEEIIGESAAMRRVLERVEQVAATNRDLSADVQLGRFRRDLFYRLNAFPVHVPPLRERPEDVPPLVAHLAAKYAARVGRTIDRVDARSLRRLARHDWPGNVRELENVVERAVILSRNGRLRVDREVLPQSEAAAGALDDRLAASERAAIEAALLASRGRVSGPAGAARRLGLAASTLEFRIRKLAIDKFRHRR